MGCMKTSFCFSLFLLICFGCIAHSAPATMRLDYYHTGDAKHEIFSVDRVVIEPLPWPGNMAKPIDETNLGKYFFEVADATSNQVQYSRGFASIFGEWEQTAEAQKVYRTFSESVRFPAPSKPVKITIKKRDDQNQFQPIFTTTIDPSNMFVDTSSLP